MFKLDDKGYPKISENFASVQVETESGNPFHHPGTGQFTFAPPGVNILIGRELIKGLSTARRKTLFSRAKVSKANQLAARVIDGKLHIALLINGRRVDSFAFTPLGNKENNAPEQEIGEGEKGSVVKQPQDSERDIITDAARTPNLDNDSLYQYLEGRGIAITEQNKEQYFELVKNKRLDDLVDYLHLHMREKVKGVSKEGTIRLVLPTGYLRKSFSGLEKEDIQLVLTRLQGRGWLEKDVQEHVTSKLPKKFKGELLNKNDDEEEAKELDRKKV